MQLKSDYTITKAKMSAGEEIEQREPKHVILYRIEDSFALHMVLLYLCFQQRLMLACKFKFPI